VPVEHQRIILHGVAGALGSTSDRIALKLSVLAPDPAISDAGLSAVAVVYLAVMPPRATGKGRYP
jgi:hypothetical protein